jgi:predicted nucleotidyltransferase
MKTIELPAIFGYNLPMQKDEALAKLQARQADFRRLGVSNLYLFGSTVRGEASDLSDVDLFFDYEKGSFGVYELMDVKSFAATVLGQKTDIMTRDSLHWALRRSIEETAVRVF